MSVDLLHVLIAALFFMTWLAVAMLLRPRHDSDFPMSLRKSDRPQ